MKIKKFQAMNFTEALALVKKELSENAIILSTDEKKGLRPFVEVTAAVDYDNEKAVKWSMSQMRNGKKDREKRAGEEGGYDFSCSPSSPNHKAPESSVSAADEIKKEIEKLREEIEGMRNNGYELSLPPGKKAVFNFLRERSVRDEFAMRVCEKTNDLKDIPSFIMSDIKVKEKNFTKKAVMLIGPTGVGKTTTIAKLAANAIREGKKIAIISLDTYRIGAIEQMRIYAKIMGVPFTVASGTDDLRKSLISYARDRDAVFIDTTGKNPRDGDYINEMLDICQHTRGEGPSGSGHDVPFDPEFHLLMCASSDDGFLTEAYRSYMKLPIDYIAFTKVDEAVRFGSLYNLMLTYQKPVAYVTTGQTVPDDIEFADTNRLTSLILTKGCY